MLSLLAQILLKILHKVQRVRFFLPHRKNVRVMQRSNTKKTFRHVLLTSKDEDTRGPRNIFLNCLSKRLQENNQIWKKSKHDHHQLADFKRSTPTSSKLKQRLKCFDGFDLKFCFVVIQTHKQDNPGII